MKIHNAENPRQLAELVSRASIESLLEYSDIDYRLGSVVTNLCESPIERRLLVDLAFAPQWGIRFDQIYIHDPAMPFPMDESAWVTFAPQYPVGRYTVDICILVRTTFGPILKIAVECDGHQFHERTKEQAAHDKKRDRELQKLGFLVFRFTGSEIHRNSKKCAEEVAEYAVNWFEQAVIARG